MKGYDKRKYYSFKGVLESWIYRLPDGMYISEKDNPKEYSEYLKWCEQGNEAPKISSLKEAKRNFKNV